MTTTIRTKRNLVIASVFAAPLVFAPLAMAEYDDEMGAEVNVSSAEVEAFAAAMVDVQELGQEWTQRMQQTDDQEELSQMQQEAQEEMIGAIEDHGMTVEEYNEIATAAQQDPELAQEIEQAAR